jgi:gluconolactonase
LGRLITNQTMPASHNKLAIIHPKERLAIIADNFEGRPFGRPNDLIVASDGGIYFTDPGPNEAQARAGHPKTEPAVHYISAIGPGRYEWGRAVRVIADLPDPNGLVLSPDGKILYVADTSSEYVFAFDVQMDGTVRNKRNFARLAEGAKAEADGMTIDNDGRLYVSVWGGVEVFDAKGQRLGLIPGSGPGNLAFGGPEKKTLYITGGTSLSKVPMIAQGVQSRKGK